MSTPIVTLTTDWGNEDFFGGMFRGRMMSLVDGVRVVDITHRIEPFNIMHAAFVMRHACPTFPPGTVHVVDVSTGSPFLAVKARGHYFICCDNGLPSLLFGNDIDDVSLLQVDANMHHNFAAFSLFAGAAAMLLGGASMRDLGEPPATLQQCNMATYIQQGDDYRIYVHYIDSYGNAYLGMTHREFEHLRGGRQFVLYVRDQEVSEVMTSYHQQHTTADPRRRLRLIVSATGLLELSVKDGSLANLVGLRPNDSVLLHFKQ